MLTFYYVNFLSILVVSPMKEASFQFVLCDINDIFKILLQLNSFIHQMLIETMPGFVLDAEGTIMSNLQRLASGERCRH